MQFEAMLRPRRPTEDGFLATYDPWIGICFSATWCGPCKRLDKKTLVEMTPDIKWYSCDVDQVQETLGYCGLHSIPGFVILKSGDFVSRKAGAGSVGEILQWLHENGAPIKQS